MQAIATAWQGGLAMEGKTWQSGLIQWIVTLYGQQGRGWEEKKKKRKMKTARPPIRHRAPSSWNFQQQYLRNKEG